MERFISTESTLTGVMEDSQVGAWPGRQSWAGRRIDAGARGVANSHEQTGGFWCGRQSAGLEAVNWHRSPDGER